MGGEAGDGLKKGDVMFAAPTDRPIDRPTVISPSTKMFSHAGESKYKIK